MTNLENLFREILSIAGEDIQRDSLQKTPERAAKAMIEMTSGYRASLGEIINGALFSASNDNMVIVKDIALYSLCEHHMLPFLGRCHIAYLPNKSILGLSKFARIVDLYAKRFQVQERLTHEIAEAIYQATDAKGVAVIIEAQHLCMMMRGVEKQNSIMKTSCMMGAFRDKQSTRMEFLDLVSSS